MTAPLEVYTKQEVAQMLRVSERTIERWVTSGDLCRIKARGHKGAVRITRKALEAFISSRERVR